MLQTQLDEATRPRALHPLAEPRTLPDLSTDDASWWPRPPRATGGLKVFCVVDALRVDAREALPVMAELCDALQGDPVSLFVVHSPRSTPLGTADGTRGALAGLDLQVPVFLDDGGTLRRVLGGTRWPAWGIATEGGDLLLWHEGSVDTQALLDAVRRHLPAKGPAWVPMEGPTVTQLVAPHRVHVFPDAIMQEMGADALHGGVLYVSDTGAHQVLELELDAGPDGWPEATLLRRFGTGQPGFDDGPASEATFRGPMGTSRATGQLLVADRDNHALRSIDLDTGAVRTLAGTGRRAAHRPRGHLRLSDPLRQPLRDPIDVEVLELKGETLAFVAMAGAHQLWAWGAGHLGLFAGSGHEDHIDGPAAEACLAQPTGLALFGRYLLFVDQQTSSVRGVDLQHHQVVTVVGKGLNDMGRADGVGESVRLQHPEDLTFVGEALFIADRMNGAVRRIDLATLQSATVAGGDGRIGQPAGIDRVGPYLIVADPLGRRLWVVHHATGEVRPLPLHGLG
jgi:hypothetical protein